MSTLMTDSAVDKSMLRAVRMQQIGQILWKIARFVIVFGLAFIILKPFLQKILMACMPPDDLLNETVQYIPTVFSTFYWEKALEGLQLHATLLNTMVTSLIVSFLQLFVCTCVGYGLARYRFVGNRLLLVAVVVIMLIPSEVYSISQFLTFWEMGLVDTPMPLYVLSFCGLGLKEGLYILFMWSFFSGLPKDLEAAAYVDGAGNIRAFVSVILPNARSIMATVFLFSFCWQWTDTSMSQLYFSDYQVLANVVTAIRVSRNGSMDIMGTGIAQNAACVLIIVPLLIAFLFCSKFVTKSFVTSGIAN